MWNRLYRNHVIMPFPSYDPATNAWAPQADISWCAGPTRESEFIKFPNPFLTEADAVTFALRRGEAWIDNRLERLRSGSGSEHAAAIDIIGDVKKSESHAASSNSRFDSLAREKNIHVWPV